MSVPALSRNQKRHTVVAVSVCWPGTVVIVVTPVIAADNALSRDHDHRLSLVPSDTRVANSPSVTAPTRVKNIEFLADRRTDGQTLPG